jgi:membrane associated rhomboid family serine protease
MAVTWIILGFTSAISLLYMQNQEFKERFMFSPYAIKYRNEWWRWFTGGFIHADGFHLLWNMVTLWSFGEVLERTFNGTTRLNESFNHPLFMHGKGSLMFFLLYMSAIPLSAVYTYYKERNNPTYRALGASGAVCAILFACILLTPTMKVGIMGIIPATGWIYGIIYILLSVYWSKTKFLNWGHDVHIAGSLYGFIFPIVFFPFLAENFVSQIVRSFVN